MTVYELPYVKTRIKIKSGYTCKWYYWEISESDTQLGYTDGGVVQMGKLKLSDRSSFPVHLKQKL
jgi:hypothetical protein